MYHKSPGDAGSCWHGGAPPPYVNDGPWAASAFTSLLSLLLRQHHCSRYKNNGKQLKGILFLPLETIWWQANNKIKGWRPADRCTAQSLNRVIKFSFFNLYYPLSIHIHMGHIVLFVFQPGGRFYPSLIWFSRPFVLNVHDKYKADAVCGVPRATHLKCICSIQRLSETTAWFEMEWMCS